MNDEGAHTERKRIRAIAAKLIYERGKHLAQALASNDYGVENLIALMELFYAEVQSSPDESKPATPTSHTTGPWRVCERIGHRITVKHDAIYPGAMGEVVALVSARVTWQAEGEANARLIAAAPKMLAALQALSKRYSICQKDNAEWELANEAIAEATGVQRNTV